MKAFSKIRLLLAISTLLSCRILLADDAVIHLSLDEARNLALEKSPLLQAAYTENKATYEAVREQRADYFPQISADATAVQTDQSATMVDQGGKPVKLNSYITAGALNTSTLLDRTAAGIQVRQLITDFGKTGNRVDSAKASYQASLENSLGIRARLLLDVTSAYYNTLQAQATVRIAQKTLDDRKVVLEKITLLAKNQLKSQLDVNFASVALKQSELFMLQAQNNLQSHMAQLAYVMGYRDNNTPTFELTEDGLLPTPPPEDFQTLVSRAFNNFPELAQQRAIYDAAAAEVRAHRDDNYPTVSLLGTAGDTFSGDDRIPANYAAIGVNINIPIVAGGKYNAATSKAEYRASAALDNVTNIENRIRRDVRLSWLDANTAYQALSVARDLQDNADKTLQLASSSYNLGLTSIVELNSAQLNAADAEIQNAQAAYQYRLNATQLAYVTGDLQ